MGVQLKTISLPSISIEENICFVKIFDFRFLMDLHCLRCPEHDLTIFTNVCLWHKFCGRSNGITNRRNYMQLYI